VLSASTPSSGMEHLWSRAVATGGNPVANGAAAKVAQTGE
jgi:hypothetical protein